MQDLILTWRPGEPQLVAQLPPEDDDACAFFVEWKTKVRLLSPVLSVLGA